jgi:hypothetical protein
MGQSKKKRTHKKVPRTWEVRITWSPRASQEELETAYSEWLPIVCPYILDGNVDPSPRDKDRFRAGNEGSSGKRQGVEYE